MNEKVKMFLDTDLLEKYLLGTTSRKEAKLVENYISVYPEVKKQYNELQENLESYSRAHALKAPKELKQVIISKITAGKTINRRRFYRYAIAASFAALMLAGTTYFFWNQNQKLINENALVNQKLKNLELDINSTNTNLEDIKNQFIVLNNPETHKYVLRGNQKAKELKTVAYINPVKKLSFINVAELPQLPEEQVFQMWANVNGQMVSLGVLEKAENKLLSVPYNEDAISFNITIEPKGGNGTATVENTVANIEFK